MKKSIVASLCALVAVGAFAQDSEYVLDLSAKITSLKFAAPLERVQPQFSGPASIVQTSVSGYLIVDAFPSGANEVDSYATVVMVDSKNKLAVFEYDIPVWIWNDGQTLLVYVNLPDGYGYSLMQVVTFGSIAFAGPVPKTISTTGAATAEVWFDANWNPIDWPAYGTVSLRLDRALTAASLGSGNSGDEVVWAYLHALRYSIEEHHNNFFIP